MATGTVHLIPAPLHEEAVSGLPPAILEAVKTCSVFFVENERTARRFLKKIWKEMVIDDYTWFTISDEPALKQSFRQALKDGKTIGIISEAGCPGVADPGQVLVAIAQEMKVPVKPVVGPNSILLALMASGMNGQQFRFAGYLPIDNGQRMKTLKDMEALSARENSTQIFIETPYRNNQLLEAICTACKPQTKVCVAVDLTAATESILTRSVTEWKQTKPELHKRPAIFLLYAGI